MTKSAYEHIQRIRREKYSLDEHGNLIGINPLASDLKDSIDHLSEGLYARNAHFIFELIQNAEDNTYNNKEPTLTFKLLQNDPTNTTGSDGAIIVENNEIGFSLENIEAICAVGKSTKKKQDGFIGEKGIGFKSVFRVTSVPFLFSNGYQISLPKNHQKTGLGFIVPEWINNVPQSIDASLTSIVLPLDQPDFGYHVVKKMLWEIEPETILFLSKLKEIKIVSDDHDEFIVIKDDSFEPKIQLLTNKNGNEEVLEYLLLKKIFEKPVDINHEKRIGVKDREVSVALPIDKDHSTSGKLFAYLPVRFNTGFPFIINADFILPSSREDITDTPWNRNWLMFCVGELVFDFLPEIKKLDQLTVKFLQQLAKSAQPIAEDDMCYPIVLAVKKALTELELLPADDGTFVLAENVKLARGAELRELLNQEQLSQLYYANEKIKWLASDITDDLTPDLAFYLKKHIGIEEVRPETFVDLLTDEFLTEQTDEWIIKFYSFLGRDRSALWKSPDSSLRTKKIIRLENNEHVTPFKADGTSNAYLPSTTKTNYPTVKNNIFVVDAASYFLKQLGLIAPDSFSEIIEFILPKYAESSNSIGLDENVNDLIKINEVISGKYQSSLSSDLSKIKILLRKLEVPENLFDGLSNNENLLKVITAFLKRCIGTTPLLMSTNGRKITYKAPSDIYINNDELKSYFSGNQQIWFLCDHYPNEVLEFAKNLGVNYAPKIEKRYTNEDGHVLISNHHGSHSRGLSGFDPYITVEGLSWALSNPTVHKSVFIWNKIAIPNVDCIRGKIEKSKRKTYENSKHEECISDNFGRLLMEKSWLPGANGIFYRPSQIALDQLPEQFNRNEKLADYLGMIKPEKLKAADILSGGDPRKKEWFEFISNAPDELLEKLEKIRPNTISSLPALSFKDGLAKLARIQRGGHINNHGEQNYPVKNPDRYQSKLEDGIANDIATYQESLQTISFALVQRNTDNKEARDFLYSQYRGRCQITGMTFMKAAANSEGLSENYFEACSLVSSRNTHYLNDAGNMLCVSADTLAKLKFASLEWLDNIADKISEFEKGGCTAQQVSLSIKLAGAECTITWSQQHFMRLVALYNQA